MFSGKVYNFFIGAAIPIIACNALMFYKKRSLLKKTLSLEEKIESAISKIAKDMGVKDVDFRKSLDEESSFVMGNDFTLIKPIFVLNLGENKAQEEFTIYHELAHLRQKHSSKSLGLTALASGLLSTFTIKNNVAGIILGMTLVSVVTIGFKVLANMQEKEADLIACQYASPMAIAGMIADLKRKSNDYNKILEFGSFFNKMSLKWSLLTEGHPLVEDRISYLKEYLYKKENLPQIDFQIIGNDSKLKLPIDISNKIRGIIKKSNREDIFIDIQSIQIDPCVHNDNLVVITSTSNRPYHLTVDRDLINSCIENKNIDNKLETKLLDIINEGLKNPISVIFEIKIRIEASEQQMMNEFKSLLSPTVYDLDKIQTKKNDMTYIIKVPKK